MDLYSRMNFKKSIFWVNLSNIFRKFEIDPANMVVLEIRLF